MLIGNNYLLLKVINFFLFKFSHLLDHIIARDEHSIEEAWVRESLQILYFTLEVYLAVFMWAILLPLQLLFLIILLLDKWDE